MSSVTDPVIGAMITDPPGIDLSRSGPGAMATWIKLPVAIASPWLLCGASSNPS